MLFNSGDITVVRCRAALAALLLSALPLAAQFEGVLETTNMTTSDTGAVEEFTMTMWIKPDRVKVSSGSETSGGGMTLIYRGDRNVVWMLNPEERTYTEIAQQGDEEQGVPMQGSGKFRIRRTGKRKKILGYPCEQIVITRGGERTELWGSASLKRLQQTLASVLGTDRTASPADWTAQVDRLGLFPLRAATTIGGRLVESQEVTRLQEMTLVPELFEVPSGYRKEGNKDN